MNNTEQPTVTAIPDKKDLPAYKQRQQATSRFTRTIPAPLYSLYLKDKEASTPVFDKEGRRVA